MKNIHIRVQNESEIQLFKDFEDELVKKLERNGFVVHYVFVFQSLETPWVSFDIEKNKKISVIQHPIPYANNGNFGFGRRPLHMLALALVIEI